MNIGISNPNRGSNESGVKQFTDPQVEAILELIYKNNVSTFAVSPVSNEKSVLTALNLNFNIQANDDVFTAASINQGIGSILADVNGGAKNISGGSSLVTKAFTMTLNYTRNGLPLSENKTVTFFAYTPQFAGVSASADLTTYAAMSADLQKFVQSSPVLVKQSSPTAQYVWFVSTKNNATILDQNNFQQTVGAWNDGVSEFYLKSISLILANGVASETVYVYRSRNVKTLTNFTYKIQ
jgi:hypothetical protein